jgi:hypothetical protein
VLARLALSRKVNSVAMEAHPGAMEYQPGILEAPTELLSTVASPGAVETIPAILLEQSHLGVKAIASHGAQSQGVMKNHNWNWRDVLEQSCCRLT